jgi:hypothetical protein
MPNLQLTRWTAIAGITGTVIQIAAFAVFLFIAGSPPRGEAQLAAFLASGNNPLQTSFLLFFAAFGVWFVFFAGLRSLMVEARSGLEYLATAVFGLGAAVMTQGFIFIGMEAAAAANALTRPDNSVIYSMYMGGSILDGTPVAATIVCLLGLAGWAIYRSRLLPAWAAWLSWIMAAVTAATLPALYQGDDLSGIYSADGLVPEVLAFLPCTSGASHCQLAFFAGGNH